MMTDRELLEMAAKAAGLKIHARRQAERDAILCGDTGLWIVNGDSCWNPLEDDGDALRLVVDLRLALLFPMVGDALKEVGAGQVGSPLAACMEPCGLDPGAATRRAIVRAAAEIGQRMVKP